MAIYDKNWDCVRDLKFRQIKLQLPNSSFRSYFNPSKNRLRKLLIKYQPINVYASISRWIYFREHGTYRNRFLDSDYLIDIDHKNINEIEEIKKFMSLHYSSLYLNHELSTGGGYHLIYSQKVIINDFEFNKELKNNITIILTKAGFNIDEPICRDIYRVSRIDETWNQNKNQWCYSLGSPLKRTMTNRIVKIQSFLPSEESGRIQSKTNVPANYNLNFISNSVKGTKGLHIPLIRWQRTRKRRLRRLIKHYKLGSYAHIKTPKYNYFLFFKCFDDRRLRKIYNFAHSNTRLEFEKFKWNWIPIKSSKEFSLEIKIYNAEGSKGNYSKPHLDFFNMNNDGIKCGNGKLKVYKAIYGVVGS